eukprot:gene10285-18982_t
MKNGCQICDGRYQKSICDRKAEQSLLAKGERGLMYPIVVDNVNGVKCRALLDTGVESSYISATLVNLLGIKPVLKQTRQIDRMLSTAYKRIEIYNVEVNSINSDLKLEIDVTERPKRMRLIDILNEDPGDEKIDDVAV